MPGAGSLRDVFSAIPDRYGYVIVPRNNFVPAGEGPEPFHERLLIRERCSANPRGNRLEPKIAQRPAAAAGVKAGNHALEAPVMDPAPDLGALDILHFPMRSPEQFEHKVLNTGTGYERLQERASGVGIDQLRLLEIHRRGELENYYRTQLRDGLARWPEPAGESPAARELLRRTWTRS